MITKEEMAARLNGRQYREETTKDDCKDAVESGLVIIYGASDDLTCFEGVVVDEAGAWEGRIFEITVGKFIACPGDHDAEYIDLGWTPPKIVMTVKAEWSPESVGCSWLITSSAPFAPFDIFEDGDLYCRGAVVEFPSAE